MKMNAMGFHTLFLLTYWFMGLGRIKIGENKVINPAGYDGHIK